jgi:hypothetical protein
VGAFASVIGFYGEVLGLPASLISVGFFYDQDANVLILHRRYAS